MKGIGTILPHHQILQQAVMVTLLEVPTVVLTVLTKVGLAALQIVVFAMLGKQILRLSATLIVTKHLPMKA